MSTRRYVEELEYGDNKGVDTTSPTSMVAQGFLRDAQNCNLGATGGFSKRDGFTKQLDTAWGARQIQNGIEFQPLTGNPQIILAGEGALGKVNDLGTAVDLSGEITSSLSDQDRHRISLVQLQGRLFGMNGDSTNAPFVYEGVPGDGIRELGIPKPAAAPAVNDAAGGSLLAGQYVITYQYYLRNIDDGQVIAISSSSDASSVTVNSPNASIDVDVVQSSFVPTGTQELVIRVFRTVVGGSTLFLDSEHPNLTAQVNIGSITDAAITVNDQLEIDHSQLDDFNGYSRPRFNLVARNRLFVAHDTKNEVRFSKVGQDGPLPESFPAINFTPTEGRDGSNDQIVGLGQVNGIPVILKSRSIGILEEVGLPEITHAEDNVTYVYRELSESIGAINHFCQTEVLNELVFLSSDNIYATDGQTIRPIATPIQATIKRLGFQNAKAVRLSMANDTRNRRIVISTFKQPTDTHPNFILVGDYQQYPTFRWTFYTRGKNITSHPGIQPGSFFSLTNSSDGGLDMFFGNATGNGQYYQMNDGQADIDYEDDSERGIFFKVVSRPYAMQAPMNTKLFQNMRIFAEAADSSYSLEFCTIYDLSVAEELCGTFTIPSVGGLWEDDGDPPDYEWAPTGGEALTWSGPNLAELNYNAHRKGKFVQLVFNQTEANAPVTLLGWGVSGSLFGGI